MTSKQRIACVDLAKEYKPAQMERGINARLKRFALQEPERLARITFVHRLTKYAMTAEPAMENA